MTPLRVALMIGGCWIIPTVISFLPIMQGWNSIGINDLVSHIRWLSQLVQCLKMYLALECLDNFFSLAIIRMSYGNKLASVKMICH